MNTTDKHIVAIDLGSSKIAVTVAKVNGNDIQIIYYRETPSEGMRYSSVFNPSNASRPLAKAIRMAEEELGMKITQAVVGMPKYPIRQETSTGKVQDRGHDTDITFEDVANLKAFAQSLYPLQNDTKEAIYGAVAQSFSDGENFQIIEEDIIGMTSDVLEGNFKIFIGNKSDLNKIDTAMTKVGIAILHSRLDGKGCPYRSRDGERSRTYRLRCRMHLSINIPRSYHAPLCFHPIRRKEHHP